MECGVRSRYMRSVFPTTTFPNHYSIVTGLYPESHGIIDNKMYDPVTKKAFSITKDEALHPSWWEGEPIWVTAEKQGKKTASNFWVGSQVKIKGVRPSYFRMYNSKSSWNCRIDTVLSWLELPEDVRPSLITLYFNQPDHDGHRHGPNSKRVNGTLKRIDVTINTLFIGLFKRNLLGCVNIIFVSDHGMTEKSCGRVIPIDKYLNLSDVYYVTGATSRIRLQHNDSEEAIGNIVESIRCRNPNLLVSRKEHLPKRYHFSQHDRIEPIVLGPAVGWYIMRTTPTDKDWKRCQGGTHGFDNMEESMQAIFIAHGPAFKQNITVEPFLNIELYNLMADLLNITGVENNGTSGSLHHMLHTKPKLFSEKVGITQLKYCQRVDTVQEALYKAGNDSCDSLSHKFIDPKTTNDHLPFGTPSQEFCILCSTDYVSAFNEHLRVPIFVSSTLHLENMSRLNESKICWHSDFRISPIYSPSILEYSFLKGTQSGIAMRPLFPSQFSTSEDVWLLSNAVPMYVQFEQTILRRLEELTEQWSAAYQDINIIAGPCFDINGNGIWPGHEAVISFHGEDPYPIPSHFFLCLHTVFGEKCQHKHLSI